jgi:DNA-binding response OmpR family regulator
MAKHILVVEDEDALCTTLKDRLQSEGYQVEFARDGIAGFAKVSQFPFDLAIVDLMLPFRSGLDLCADIRRAGMSIPIIILTAKSQTADKVVGLKMGADDYVCKPFDTLELIARVEAQLRRSSRGAGDSANKLPEVLQFGSIVLDTKKMRVTRDGKPVSLTVKEYQLFHYLAAHTGQTISRDKLLLEVWGHKAGTLTRTVDMHIVSLRQKLERIPKKPELVLTVPGFGYTLASDSGGRDKF